VRLHFRSGGSALLVADPGIFRNRTLRDTDAGTMVIGWVFEHRPRALVVDEYHQGFGRSASLPGAVVARVWNTPVGWLLVQLVLAGVLLLALGALRFGPERPVIDSRRRSPLEHLDALAAGLERTHSAKTAVGLILAGLQRRLGSRATIEELRARTTHHAAGTTHDTPPHAARPTPDDASVMTAANEVEDLWESLKATRTRS
jgi:hypothetical protein